MCYKECLIWRNLAHPHILHQIGVHYEVVSGVRIPCIVTPWIKRGTARQAIYDFASGHVGHSERYNSIHTWVRHHYMAEEL